MYLKVLNAMSFRIVLDCNIEKYDKKLRCDPEQNIVRGTVFLEQ